MNEDDSFGLTKKETVNIYSEPSGLALTFAELLLRNLHRVNIYTENPDEWIKLSFHLKDNFNLKIFSSESREESEYHVYFSLLSSQISGGRVDELLFKEKEKVGNIFSELKAYKTFLVICPYSQPIEYEKFYSKLFNVYFKNLNKTKVVFYENLLGKRMLLTPRDILANLAVSLLKKGAINTGLKLFPTDLDDFVNKIESLLLSDKGFNKNTVYMGKQEDPMLLKKGLIERGVIAQNIQSKSTAEIGDRVYADCDRFVEIKMQEEFQYNLIATLEYLKRYGFQKETQLIIARNITEDKAVKEELLENNAKGDENKEKKQLQKQIQTTVSTPPLEQIKTKTVETTKPVIKPIIKKVKKTHFKKPEFKIHVPNITLINKTKFVSIWEKIKIALLRKPKEKKEKSYSKNKAFVYFKYLFFIILIVLSPYIVSTLSLLFLLVGGRHILNSKIEESGKYFVVSEKIGEISRLISRVSIQIPLVGGFYSTANTITNLTFTSSDVLADSVDILEKSQTLFLAVLNDSNFDLDENSGEISIGLDSLYRKISFLQSEYQEIPESLRNVLVKYVDDRNIERVKTEVVSFARISTNASKILGSEGKSSYLVLFQNNMELRPTGGFIGSFGILSFQDGKMINLEVYDVYSADGQLKGYVKPPEPIVKYLNQAVWYLRDSNWDPDFGVASEKAQWFLEKEMDIKVDGVFSVDLEFVKGLLEVTGPIFLNDYDKEINAQNMYEITQYEVEKEFFPGSRKKSNFLSSLVSEMMFKMKSDTQIDYVKLARVIHKALQEKHVQLSFNSYDVASEFQRLGWDGGIRDPKCIDVNCYSDLTGVVEANVGVNKANYYVERKGSFKNSLENGKVIREMDLVYTSNANPALAFKGTYKNYLRVMGPPDSVFDDVKIISIDGESSIKADIEKFENRTEAGVYVEIAPGQTKRINFSWSSDTQLNFNTNGKYLLNIRKQSGINDFNFDVNINLPKNIHFGVLPKTMLTQVGGVRYNTMLSKDENIGIYW